MCEIYIYIYIYIYKEILFIHKKEWNPAICHTMDGSWEHLAKWNKSENDKYHIIPLTHGIF